MDLGAALPAHFTLSGRTGGEDLAPKGSRSPCVQTILDALSIARTRPPRTKIPFDEQ